MAFLNLGPLQNLLDGFTDSLNNVFGGGQTKSTKLQTIDTLVRPEANLSADSLNFDPKNWTGNTNRKDNKLRYGFKIVDAVSFGSNLALGQPDKTTSTTYYLDIPPQAISQKEVFATNITATRRGVMVESEGVVFKDIVIAGTTGVFPGARDGYGGQQANFSDFTKPKTRASGVQDDGTSKTATVVSGYAEFLGLRAFFLKYAQSKIASKGTKFLVFINEKDQQALVVEPLEFTMERNSKNPMQYQYRIVLKCIASLDEKFSELKGADDPNLKLNDIVEVSRNAVAAIEQFRAAVGATNRLVQSVSQEIDKTFIQPLRLLGTALNDVAEARANILSVPTILKQNLNESVLSIQENRFTKSKSELTQIYLITSPQIAATTPTATSGNNPSDSGKISQRGSTDFLTSTRLLDRSKAENFVNSTVLSLEQSSISPIPKSQVLYLRNTAQALADDIADVVNLGNASYDIIKNRTSVFLPNPLRVATNSEYLLLGSTLKLIAALNQVLATNNLFLVDTDQTFENDQEALQNIVELQAPSTAREITIMQGDTLERIALREYGSVSRWVEISILNNLKYPYIAETAGDGIKAYGDKILVGN